MVSPQSSYSVLQHLGSYIKKYWKYLTFSMISASFFGLFAAIPSYIVQHTVDKVFIERHEYLLIPFIGLFIILFILKGIFMYLSQYYMHRVGFQVINDMRNDLFQKIISFPLRFFPSVSSGTIMSYFFNDMIIVQNTISSAIRNGIRSIFEATFLIAIACMQSWKLSLMMFIVGPAIGLAIKKTSSAVRIASRNAHDTMAQISSATHEVFIGIRDVKAYNAESIESLKFAQRLNTYFSCIMQSLHFGSLAPALIEVIAMSGIGVVLYIASREVLYGVMTPGQLTSFFSAVLLAYQPLKKVITIYADLHYGISAADRIFELLHTSYEDTTHRIKELTSFTHSLTFENVSFSYTPEKIILKNLSLTIKKGESIALIGSSGCGKSTMCDLICGFLEPTLGFLKIDGISISQITYKSLRNHIGYIAQQPFLFNDTIFENIAYGKQGATQEEVERACKAAHAHEFIQELPHGYATIVGENGCNLSGGQKQRLTIARALIKEPEILIFDEATSALDKEAETIIRRTIQELKGEKTMIVISHRTSLLNEVDTIYELENKQLNKRSLHHLQEKTYQKPVVHRSHASV